MSAYNSFTLLQAHIYGAGGTGCTVQILMTLFKGLYPDEDNVSLITPLSDDQVVQLTYAYYVYSTYHA
jgi:hypothetical protein